MGHADGHECPIALPGISGSRSASAGARQWWIHRQHGQRPGFVARAAAFRDTRLRRGKGRNYYGKDKIRFNALAPGLVETPMSKRAQENPEICEYIRGKQPLAEGFIQAGDVAEAALFLLSDESRYITGEVLTVDAGWRLG